MCVFTLCCFLAKFVRPSLKLVGYIKEGRSKMPIVEMFLGIVFICSMENVVCVCAASLVEMVVSVETKWSYEKLEKAARIIGRARDCVRRCLAKVLFAVGGNELWSHREVCVSGGFGEEACVVSIKVAQR